MLEVGRYLDLFEEPLGTQDGRKLGTEHLHRHLPVVLQVLGQPDGGHAPGAQLTLQSITVLQRVLQAVDGLALPGGRRTRQAGAPGCAAL